MLAGVVVVEEERGDGRPGEAAHGSRRRWSSAGKDRRLGEAQQRREERRAALDVRCGGAARSVRWATGRAAVVEADAAAGQAAQFAKAGAAGSRPAGRQAVRQRQ